MKEREALKLALDALRMPCNRWNKTQAIKVQEAIKAGEESLEHPEQCKYGQEPKSCTSSPMDCQCAIDATFAQPEQEPVTWRNAAIRVGEDLCSVGPFRYYDMTAEQWLDWALSVVTVHAPQPQRTWVELTEDEIFNIATFGNDGGCFGDFQWQHDTVGFVRAVEAKFKEKNT